MKRSSALIPIIGLVLATACGDPDTTPNAGTAEVDSTSATGPADATSRPTEPATTIAPGVDPDIPPSPASPTTLPSDLGGFDDPVQAPNEFGHASSQLLTGTIEVAGNGCWMIDINDQRRPVAFPTGWATLPDDPATIIGADGLIVVAGTRIDATGQVMWIDSVPGGVDGRWGNLLAVCDPGGVEIARLDAIDPAYDPTTLDPAQLVEKLRASSFTDSWPCGFGWQASTADQRFGLVLRPISDVPSAGTITLPSETWTAEVVVGKHLFVQNCDDAIEQWESSPIVLAERWPVESGTFEVPVTDNAVGACRSNPVSTVLNAGVVETPLGPIELPSVSIENDAWGCFAG